MKSRKLNIRVRDDEAAVVASLEFWSNLEEHFRGMANAFPEEAEGWTISADLIRENVEKTKKVSWEEYA